MRHAKKRLLKYFEASFPAAERNTELTPFNDILCGRRQRKLEDPGSQKKRLNFRMVCILVPVVTLLPCSLKPGITANAKVGGDECPEGATKWRLLAERGDARAQFNVGVCYETDQDDPAEAIRWHRRAAAQGHELAMWNLYTMYRRHHGVPPGQQAASDWLRQAAEDGDAVAQYLVAEASIYGIDKPSNLVKAYMWLSLSANQGFPAAIRERELLERRLSPSQVAKGLQLANEWNRQK